MILDAKGNPVKPEPPQNALQAFMDLPAGVKDRGDFLEIPKSLLMDRRREQARRIAVSSVPSTPAQMTRDVGGIAVSKGHGRWPSITMDTLRDIREMSPILQPLHNARGYQARRLGQKFTGKKGTVGLRVAHKDHLEPGKKAPEGFQQWVDRFEAVFWCPSPTYGITTVSTAMAMLIEDLMTINRPTVELIHSRLDSKRVVQWRPVDGGIIWPTLMFVEKWIADNPRWQTGYNTARIRTEEQLLDVISNSIQQDLFGAEHVLVRDGMAQAVYPRGKLIVAPIINRTDIRYAGYPPGHVEQAMVWITAFADSFNYNTSHFKGMLAEFILGLPSGMHDEDVDAFMDMFREATMGVPWRPPMLPLPPGSEIKKIDLRTPINDMAFGQFLSMISSAVCAIYRAHDSLINGKPWEAGGGSKLGESSQDEQLKLAQDEGLQGDIGHLIDSIFNPMAMRCHPDLRVFCEYGNYDPKSEADLYETRGKTDMTRNEIRVELGRKPIGFWLSDEQLESPSPEDLQKFLDNPWNMTTDPVMASLFTAAKQRDQQDKQMAQAAAIGTGGDPSADGYGQEDPAPDDGADPYGADPTDQHGGTPQDDGYSGATKPPGMPGTLAKAMSTTFHIHLHGGADERP